MLKTRGMIAGCLLLSGCLSIPDDIRAALRLCETPQSIERLAQFGSFDDAVAHVSDHPSVMVSPRIEKRGEEVHLCIPEGIGYPVTSEPMDAVQRGFKK